MIFLSRQARDKDRKTQQTHPVFLQTTASAMRAVAKAGGWVWQMFSGLGAPPDTGAACVTGYHSACAELRTDMNMMGLRLKDPHAPGATAEKTIVALGFFGSDE